MWLSLKTLTLLWAINFAPFLLDYLFGQRWSNPVDRGLHFIDGKPLLGTHKKERGVLGGIIMGLAGGVLLGFPWNVGLLAGILSMSGDLFASFIKRRRNLPCGSHVPGLDQIFEGLFPFWTLGPYCSFKGWHIVLLVIVFSVGAYAGSWFLKKVLLEKPFSSYPRSAHPRTRLREWRACQMANNPLHPFFNFERAIYYHLMMKTTFRLFGVYEQGKRNALRLKQENVTFRLPGLPAAFEDYTILFLSDLHLDGLEGLTESLYDLLRGVSFDLCILGGDYRMEVSGPFTEALLRLNYLMDAIHVSDGIYAVLGNHDCLEMVGPLEKKGITFLVNDARAIKRKQERIWLVGVDDPHYYQSHDLKDAFRPVPEEAFTIFVAHSPEVYREAARYRPDLYLCGHTHAGQIQLPRIGPVFTHSRAPRQLSYGVWEYQGMPGYTTSGVGVSGVSVRFGCEGEVVRITLKKSVRH